MTTTWTEAEQREHRKQWVEALRSGKYQQAHGYLRRRHGFCCLGVACDISGLGEWNANYAFVGGLNDRGLRVLPMSVRNWLGLNGPEGDFWGASLADMNDEGKSFADLADIIESEPEGLIAKVSA